MRQFIKSRCKEPFTVNDLKITIKINQNNIENNRAKLDGKNTALAIKTWAISVIRYRAGIFNWSKMELERQVNREINRTIYGM